jgi:hypothetical protein
VKIVEKKIRPVRAHAEIIALNAFIRSMSTNQFPAIGKVAAKA